MEQIVPRLPGDFPIPILIVQHMPASFLTSFAQRLHSLCAIEVHEARDNEIVRPGTVLMGDHVTSSASTSKPILQVVWARLMTVG